MNLDVVGLVATLVPMGWVRRDVGKTGHVAPEQEPPPDRIQIQADPAEPEERFAVRKGIAGEGGLAHPVLGKTVQVEIGEDDPGFFGKPLRFRQQVSVFKDHGMAVPGQVRRGFPRTGGGIQIGGDAAGGLVRGQAQPVFRLPDRHVGGGKVPDHGCPGHHRERGRGDRHPDVLADFQEETKVRDVGNIEQQVGAEGDVLPAAQIHGFGQRLLRGAELATLVELPVIGQAGLHGDSGDPAPTKDNGAVEQAGVATKGRADHEDQVQRRRFAGNPLDRADDPLQKRLLLEEIVVGIGRDSQFREERENGLVPGGLPGQADGFIRVEFDIRHPDFRGADGHPGESVTIQIEKMAGLVLFHRYSFSTQA